jgi:threonine synthase
MKYISTRGDQTERGFSDILLEGLAPDGGLYLPKTYPKVDAATLSRWRGLAYADLAFEILSLYIDDIPADDLRAITHKVYTAEVFGIGLVGPHGHRDAAACPPGGVSEAWGGPAPLSAITPLTWLGDGIALQGLSNGPTLAFKDMAMQLLGALFEYELGRRGETLNILGATSGDTGSAAEYAMRGKRGVNVFMLSPHGRMSPFQQAQMFTPTSTTSPSKACSTTARTSSRRCPTTWPSSVSTASARSIPSTGRGCWRRSSTTSPATSRPRRRTSRRSASPCRQATSATFAPATWHA